MASAIDFLPTISSCQAVSQMNLATARWRPHAGYARSTTVTPAIDAIDPGTDVGGATTGQRLRQHYIRLGQDDFATTWPCSNTKTITGKRLDASRKSRAEPSRTRSGLLNSRFGCR